MSSLSSTVSPIFLTILICFKFTLSGLKFHWFGFNTFSSKISPVFILNYSSKSTKKNAFLVNANIFIKYFLNGWIINTLNEFARLAWLDRWSSWLHSLPWALAARTAERQPSSSTISFLNGKSYTQPWNLINQKLTKKKKRKNPLWHRYPRGTKNLPPPARKRIFFNFLMFYGGVYSVFMKYVVVIYYRI